MKVNTFEAVFLLLYTSLQSSSSHLQSPHFFANCVSATLANLFVENFFVDFLYTNIWLTIYFQKKKTQKIVNIRVRTNAYIK